MAIASQRVGIVGHTAFKASSTLYNNTAGFHNSIYRGKDVTSYLTDGSLWGRIAGSSPYSLFEDLFIGDYFVANGVTWRIAAFDYWLNVNSYSTHHIVIVPDNNLATCAMNDQTAHGKHTTEGAYYNSDFRKGLNGVTGRATAITAINNAFGSSHIITYKDYLHSAVVDGHPSGQEWADCTVELMNEEMVYGTHIFAPIGPGTSVYANYTTSKSQLPLFQHDHSRISNRANWWLRSVVSASNFANVNNNGNANNNNAGYSYGVRPDFQYHSLWLYAVNGHRKELLSLQKC